MPSYPFKHNTNTEDFNDFNHINKILSKFIFKQRIASPVRARILNFVLVFILNP